MTAPALIQQSLIDVASWESDSEFGVYPQGARAKDAVFAPDNPEEGVISANRRYLFKRSKKSYPDQFWGEIVAYRIGCLLGVTVPPAFAAWNSESGHCGALIEWFYIDGFAEFYHAGDSIHEMDPSFDRDKGSTHNLHQNSILLRAKLIEEYSWQRWWVDALLFDALIGNTDRHQDNWGFLFEKTKDEPPRATLSLAPLFDNGTSLGHEPGPSHSPIITA